MGCGGWTPSLGLEYPFLGDLGTVPRKKFTGPACGLTRVRQIQRFQRLRLASSHIAGALLRGLAKLLSSWAGLVLVISSVGSAHAEQDWALRVDCPELTTEQSAEVEVRHLIELRSLAEAPATLHIRCAEVTVDGSWVRDGVLLSKRSVTRTSNDDLLELAHWMASILVGIRPGKTEASSTAPSAPLQQREDADASVRRGEPRPPLEPSPAIPPETEGEGRSSPTSGSAHARTSSSRAWFVGGGASYHHWDSEVVGSLGPTLDAGVFLLRRWGIHGVVSYEWGLGRGHGIASREAALSIHAVARAAPWLFLLAGPVLSIIRVRGDTQKTDQAHVTTTFGAEVSLRAQFPERLGGFAVLGLRALASAREVRVDDALSLYIPSWQWFGAVGFQFSSTHSRN